MTFSNFKVLTFDVVGTLIHFERGMVEYIRGTGVESLKDLSDDELFKVYRRHRSLEGSNPWPDDMSRVYTGMAADLNLPNDAAHARGFAESASVWPAYPDSVEALKRLRTRFKLVAMTNARRWALDLMATTLGDPFDIRISADDAKARKPDPQFFAFARGRLSAEGISQDQILHVAQSQYHDIGIARKLGFKTCWIERRQGQEGFGLTAVPESMTVPDFHFAKLSELADAVGV